MLNLLPEEDQNFALEFIKKLVLAWDPDFTKVTTEEAVKIREAENGGFVAGSDIDWENLGVYAN